VLYNDFLIEANDGILIDQAFWIYNQGNLIERSVYNFLDMQGDLGGIIEIVEVGVGFFVFQLSEFAFNMDMIKYFFKARTTDSELFSSEENDD
jgi:hypothetical protein